jgi:hypothetical protein
MDATGDKGNKFSKQQTAEANRWALIALVIWSIGAATLLILILSLA